MSAAQPEVSVIMTVRNAESTVMAAIASIRRQTFTNWELIVVDDGSEDGTSALLSACMADSRVHVIRNESTRGRAESRNVAISEARGEFIAVADGDDVSLPDRLQLQVQALRDNPDCVACAGQLLEFWPGAFSRFSRWPTSRQEIAAALAAYRMPVAHCALMIRTECFRSVGGYPTVPDERPRRSEDYGLMLRLTEMPVMALPEVVVLYRHRKPQKLNYAVGSGRGGAFARIRAKTGNPTQTPRRSEILKTDTQAFMYWIYENVKCRIETSAQP